MITALDPKTALVLIDLQNGITGMQTIHPAGDVIAQSAKLVDAFRAKNLPVFFVRVNPVGAKWTLARAQESHMPKDEDAIRETRAKMEAAGFFEIVPQLEVKAEDV